MSEPNIASEQIALAEGLRALADDSEVLWTVARAAIEDALIEWRDDRLSMLDRNNGFVVKEKDGTDPISDKCRECGVARGDHDEFPDPGGIIGPYDHPFREPWNPGARCERQPRFTEQATTSEWGASG